jgi:CBS domain-containing protein
LFEFSPRSIIPEALACITGAAGHHFLFDAGPVFPVPTIQLPGNYELFGYSAIGIFIGLLSVLVTKSVYWIEDLFEHLPIHWMWWPAIGGLCVGVIGYFAPHTLGVGYDNITTLLSGNAPLKMVLSLCFLKFLSWALALGSGTSGGTLAPLLTIGGACGVLLGSGLQYLFPMLDVSVGMAALIGMSAMFAGSSRALLTSIVFALETTGQANALLPLLAACTAAYIISFIFMENTIMTEKIVRRGVKTPVSFEPDLLKKITVQDAVPNDKILFNEKMTIAEVKRVINRKTSDHHFVLVDNNQKYVGLVNVLDLLSGNKKEESAVGNLAFSPQGFVHPDNILSEAVSIMNLQNTDVLPVISKTDKTVIGVISYKDILKIYSRDSISHEQKKAHISLKRKSLKILVFGKNLMKIGEGNK